jgi:hypothetical protein
MTSKVHAAVENFFTVADHYSEFGASDTEPRAEFAQVLFDLREGRDYRIPRTIGDWQLFDREILGRSGAGKAARALTHATIAAVAEGKADPKGLREAIRYFYG